MPIAEAIRLALSQLRAQKLKSVLTLTGVVISVTFLITVVSIIEGINVFVHQTMAVIMAGNTFELRKTSGIRFGEIDEQEARSWMRRKAVREEDIGPVLDVLPPGVLWTAHTGGMVMIASPHGTADWTMVFAASGDFLPIHNTKIERGRAPTAQELELGSSVAVIGPEVATAVFGDLDPLDRGVKILGIPYRIIGVGEKKGAMFGESMDRWAFIPLRSPARRTLGKYMSWEPWDPASVEGIKFQSTDPALLAEAKENVRQVMRVRHHLRPGDADDFTLETSEAGMAAWGDIKGKLIAAAAILPTIGLIIGAMVIMNIMLVAVAERTREIGIRKALGARRWDILSQFLVEAATISTIGAALGIAGGIAAAKTISHFTPLPAAVALWSIPVGLMIGAVVGIAAGMYPASRAAKLDPIAALRFET
jgi:putative ABC transport system permease protein